MRIASGVLAVMLAAGPVQAEMVCTTKGAVTNCETPGNLAPTQKRGCITLSAADVSMSPADLAVSVLACVKKGREVEAAELMALMMARGRFDMARVTDKTAHQAPMVLQIEIAGAMTPAQKKKMDAALKAMVTEPNGKAYAEFCARVAALGVPAHDPGYMISHGMGGKGTGLVKGFKPKAAWKNVMRQFLKCPG